MSEKREKILSISIAAYNVEAFIEKTLQSLIVDSHYMEMLDILVIDDGSRDRTAEIVQKYCAQYPESIRLLSKPNGGYGSTINASLTIAKGRYFKLLDGDDWYDTEAIPSFLDYLQTADSDVVLTPYYEIYENKDDEHCVDNHRSIPCRDTLIEQVNFENDIQMHEMAVKTSVLRDNSVNISEHCFYTDVEFVFYSILYAQRVSRYPQAVYCYRLGLEGQSVSLVGIRKHYTDLLRVVDKIYREFHGHHDELESVKLHVLENKVERVTHNVYVAFLLLEDTKTARNRLIDFDKKLYERYREIYDLSMKSKTIRCLRAMRFQFYRIFCQFVLRKYCTQ